MSEEETQIITEQLKLTTNQKKAADSMMTWEGMTFQEVINEVLQKGFEEHEKIQKIMEELK